MIDQESYRILIASALSKVVDTRFATLRTVLLAVRVSEYLFDLAIYDRPRQCH
jgi:hypothetical protein